MSALGELRETLRQVETSLDRAHARLAHGRRRLTEAEVALARINPDHPEMVVPPELHRADDQIEHTLTLIEQVVDTLRDYATRL